MLLKHSWIRRVMMTIAIRIGLMLVSAFIFHFIFKKVNIHEKLVEKYKLDSFFRNIFFHTLIYFGLSFATIAVEYYVRGGAAKTTYSDIFVGGIIIASMLKTIDIVNSKKVNEKKSLKSKTKHKKKKRKKR